MSYFHTHLYIWVNGNGTHLYILLGSFCKRVAWEPAGRAANVNTPVKQLFMCLQFKLREGNKVVFPTFSHRLVVPSKLVIKTAISAFFMGYYWGARLLGSIGQRFVIFCVIEFFQTNRFPKFYSYSLHPSGKKLRLGGGPIENEI